MSQSPQRATSVEQFTQMQAKMFHEDTLATIDNFRPAAGDIIISPFGKCGTTWLQQMVHTLRTRGDTDYDDISRVVPWIETAALLGIDLDAPQKALPRAYKSHLAWDQIPKGGRYIVSIRNPKDALVSMFHFMQGWFIEPDSVSISDFAEGLFTKHGQQRDYWHHLASWWRERSRDEVLLLSYEGMVRSAQNTVQRVAEFIDVDLDPELRAITLANTSLDFMLANKNKFDDLLMRQASEQALGLPPGSDSAKVRAGKVGAHKTELPEPIIAQMDQIWEQTIGEEFGFASYEAMEGALP